MSLLRYLTAALVAGIALSLAPTQPVHADEDPGYRAKRVRTYAPRVRIHRPARVVHVRTVERVRTRVVYVPQPVAYGCGGCAPAPVYYNTCGTCAPAIAPPLYYGGCCSGAHYGGYGYGGYGVYGGYVGYGYGAPYYRGAHRALPYYWAVRHARYYRHGRHAWHHGRWHY
jgi:hypothetical protein